MSQHKKQSKNGFSVCECHPWRGAMLVFSISFQIFDRKSFVPILDMAPRSFDE
jgi:hypothetical protein